MPELWVSSSDLGLSSESPTVHNALETCEGSLGPLGDLTPHGIITQPLVRMLSRPIRAKMWPQAALGQRTEDSAPRPSLATFTGTT